MGQSVKPVDAGVSVGQVFQGKYRVEAILGHGGMGVVAECTHLALNERVAIKMLRQDVLLDQDAVSRFIREAQAAVKLKSEYVARVSDVGTFENGVPYMVMEFLEGHDLGELLKQQGVLPVQWAVELMLQTAEALAEAHSLSIVHRDVKPTNLFVTWRPDGSSLVKVLDFGISKSPLGNDMQLTQTQSLLGTPAYMSPEQMRSARLVDARTDIWSLGTVFYEVLEGRRPFEAESFSEMCVKVAVDPPAPMVNTPPGLQQVIMRCLAKSPEQRYASMAELGRDLIPYAADPHGAQVLVERMSRMLRRAAQTSHDVDANGVGRARDSARELGSGPVRLQTPVPQLWGSGSDPAARPWHGTTPRGDGSQPFAQPLPDDKPAGMAGPTVSTAKKSRWPLVVLVLLVATGAVAAGVYAAQRDTVPVAKHAPSENEGTTVQLKESAGSAAVDTNPEATPEVETKAVVDATPVVEVAPVEAKVEAKPEIKKPKVIKKADPKTPKPAAAGAAPPAEIKKEPAAKPADKPCNPFESMHGCPAK